MKCARRLLAAVSLSNGFPFLNKLTNKTLIIFRKKCYQTIRESYAVAITIQRISQRKNPKIGFRSENFEPDVCCQTREELKNRKLDYIRSSYEQK
jgi:hypothetical protein